MMIRLDREIEAKYDVIAKMGEGGFGSVYKVRHKVFQEIRVIKTAKYPESETAERTRFISEAKRGYHFRHEAIAKVLDFEITSEGTAYIAMEFIDGMNLRELLTISRQPLETERVIDFALQTLGALGYLHERGVVHRDISPDNLMLTRPDQRIKLIDLGIAKSIEGSQSLTLDGRFIGKVSYASPEQFSGNADPRSDLYSLGVVMYEMLTGQRPVKSTDPRAVMAAHIMGELRSFSDADPEGRVPMNLRAVVVRALRREPADRFPSASEFAAALQALKHPAPLEKTQTVEIATEDLEAMKASRSEQIAWDAAFAADSPKGWEAFLARYGSSAKAKAARARLDELEQIEEADWSEAAKSETKDGWRQYLTKHADAPRASRARRRLEKIEAEEAELEAFDAAAKADTVFAWQVFLGQHGDGAHAANARARLESSRDREEEARAWNAALRARTAAAWKAYLDAHPNSARTAAAREAYDEMSERELEAADFDFATRTATIKIWLEFVTRHPESPRIGDAREQLRLLEERAAEEAGWNSATQRDTVDAWREFLRTWGGSPRAAEAQRLLAAAQQREIEERDWFDAAAAESVDAWRAFLEKHGSSSHAAAARMRLAAAEEAVAEETAWVEAATSRTSAGWSAYLQRFPQSHRRTEAERRRGDAEREEAVARAFAEAEGEATSAAWLAFLERHGNSRFAGDARERLATTVGIEEEQRAFAEAERVDSVEAWNAFAKWFPRSTRIAEARDRLARAEEHAETQRREEEARRIVARRDAALKAGTPLALENFLSSHGESEYAQEIRARLDEVRAEKARLEKEVAERARIETQRQVAIAAEERAWQQALARNTVADLQSFIDAYSQSAHVTEARNRIETIQEVQRKAAEAEATRQRLKEEAAKREATIAAEKRAFRQARAHDTVADLQAFVDAFPQSAYVAEANHRIEAIREAQRREAEEEAEQQRLRKAAAEREAAIDAERRAWRQALARNTVADLQSFIDAHSQSPRVSKARRKIEAIEKVQRKAAEEDVPRAKGPAPSPLRRWSIAAAIVSIAAGSGYWLMRKTLAPMAPPTVSAAVMTTVAPPPPPPAGSGQLIVNANPWGEIVSIKDAPTQKERVESNHPLYTPAVIALPPGQYTVVLANPNSKKRVSYDVKIVASQSARVDSWLDKIDPAEYLSSLPQE